MDLKLNLVLMGARLRSCRSAKHMTMKEFSELCGISERYLADIERGYKAPKLETLVRIANAAGVSSDFLLRDSLEYKNKEVSGIQDSLSLYYSFTPIQQEIIGTFIRQLADSLK
ncbi:MAG: helix-turn-helix transcriptional regulator [Lachnospiraceae bacterium]